MLGVFRCSVLLAAAWFAWAGMGAHAQLPRVPVEPDWREPPDPGRPVVPPPRIEMSCHPTRKEPGSRRITVFNRGPDIAPKGTIVTITYAEETPRAPGPGGRPSGSPRYTVRTGTFVAPIDMPAAFAIGSEVFGAYCVRVTYVLPEATAR